MGIIRGHFIKSIEESLQSIPEGAEKFEDLCEEDMGVDRVVQYKHFSGNLGLDLRITVGASKVVNSCVDHINMVWGVDDFQIKFLREKSTFDGATHMKRPKEFEGSSSTLTILKLGRVARTLRQATKVIEDSDSRRVCARPAV